MIEMVPAAILTCINGASGRESMGTRTTATMTAMLPSPPIGWGMVAKATFTTDRGASKRQNKTIDLKKLKGQVDDDIQ